MKEKIVGFVCSLTEEEKKEVAELLRVIHQELLEEYGTPEQFPPGIFLKELTKVRKSRSQADQTDQLKAHPS